MERYKFEVGKEYVSTNPNRYCGRGAVFKIIKIDGEDIYCVCVFPGDAESTFKDYSETAKCLKKIE